MEPTYCVVLSDFCWSVSDWAAWVQAVGSVAAIYFAGSTANKQLRHQREDAVTARIQELDKLQQFFDHCHSVFLKLREWNSAPREWREKQPFGCMEYQKELEVLARRTKEIPIQALAAPNSMSYIISMERALETAANSVVGYEDNEENFLVKSIIETYNSNLTNAISLSALITGECLSNMQALQDSLKEQSWNWRLCGRKRK